jgi:hypothetical protein
MVTSSNNIMVSMLRRNINPPGVTHSWTSSLCSLPLLTRTRTPTLIVVVTPSYASTLPEWVQTASSQVQQLQKTMSLLLLQWLPLPRRRCFTADQQTSTWRRSSATTAAQGKARSGMISWEVPMEQLSMAEKALINMINMNSTGTLLRIQCAWRWTPPTNQTRWSRRIITTKKTASMLAAQQILPHTHRVRRGLARTRHSIRKTSTILILREVQALGRQR